MQILQLLADKVLIKAIISIFTINLKGHKMSKKNKLTGRNFNKPKVNIQKASKMANEAIEFCKNGDYKRGIRLFRKAEERAGNNDLIYLNLAIAYHASGEFINARKYYAKAIKSKPEHIMRVLQNGINELSMSKLDSAECCIGAVFDIDPENVTAKLATGSLLLRRGEKKEGAALLRACYLADPKMTSAIMELAEFSEITEAELKSAEDNMKNGLGERVNDKFLQLALGKGYDLIGDYTKAFDCYRKANEQFAKEAQLSCSQAASDLQGHYESVKQSLTTEYISKYNGVSDAGKDMIFVVGLPRSGLHDAALLLQESSRAVISAEMNWCNQKIFQMLQANDNNFCQAINTITPDTIEILVNDYTKIITPLLKTSKYVVNCKVSNFVNVWFIKILFPKAKIVCAKRNIEDQVLDIFFNNTVGMEYFNDLVAIGKYCKTYQDIMDYWDKLFDGDIIYFNYDQFSVHPEDVYAKLMTELGISEYSALDFVSVDKPSLNLKEVYCPTKSLTEKYMDFTRDLESVLNPEKQQFGLNFGNFNTASDNEESASKLSFNFGNTENNSDKDNSDGFKLNF